MMRSIFDPFTIIFLIIYNAQLGTLSIVILSSVVVSENFIIIDYELTLPPDRFYVQPTRTVLELNLKKILFFLFIILTDRF